ncbi:MAG: glucose-6-phosphate dehydrogenase [Methylococcus sp.]|nr:MAG: glucose-6-phosphate dehydrogenase [Methylococcus sp.]
MSSREYNNPSVANRGSDSCVMVIFGATGDLTRRKLIPALYNLAKARLLSPNFAIVGIGSKTMEQEAFNEKMLDAIREYAKDEVDLEILNWFGSRITYVNGDFGDDGLYGRLDAHCQSIKTEKRISNNHFYYLATAPSFFGSIIQKLGAAGMTKEDNESWRRVIIEKPFGRDLASAMELNIEVKNVLKEKQIFRIDHYLGKETVQNLMVLRFANSIFEPIWNRRYIDNVQITASEIVGVGQRGPYYETSGALRDMVPNHLFQLLSLTTMEPPVSFEANAVRDEQTKALRAIQVLTPEEVLARVVRGQYGAGEINGESCIAYRDEEKIEPDSSTETFVAMKLMMDNWRWADVPFYLRTGKRLAARTTEIVINFRKAPFVLFKNTAIDHLQENRLVIHIQPDEGISMQFGAKKPGPIMNLGSVQMDFNYVDAFGATPDTGYERLMLDCMVGDATLFQRADMVETSWNLIQPILDVWNALKPRDFPNYASGSFGPAASDQLLSGDGKKWLNKG